MHLGSVHHMRISCFGQATTHKSHLFDYHHIRLSYLRRSSEKKEKEKGKERENKYELVILSFIFLPNSDFGVRIMGDTRESSQALCCNGQLRGDPPF